MCVIWIYKHKLTNKNLRWPKRLRHKQDPRGTIKNLSAQLREPRTAHTRALENKRASRHKQIPHDAKKYLTAQLTIDN